MMVSFLSDLQEVNEEWTQRACMLVKKMTVLDSRFLGLGIPLKMIDMADYMVNDNRSLLLMDPLYLVRDFCRDEMIIPDGGSRTAAIYLRNPASTDDPGATASYRCSSSPSPKS